jgi:hypothetical protein
MSGSRPPNESLNWIACSTEFDRTGGCPTGRSTPPGRLATLLLDDLALLMSEGFQSSGGDGRTSRGTLTFLFADMERSTRLLEELGEGYADLVHTCRRAHLGERRSGRDRGGAPSGQPLDLRGGLGLGGPCVVESAALRLRANYREVRVHGLSDATGEFALDDG